MGVIGLGTGTLATYGDLGGIYVFYVLKPNVEWAVKNYLSYLSTSKADVSARLGDARITLQNKFEESGSQQYQV